MERIRVLLVDDEEEFVESAVKRLVNRGLEAVGALSGMQALELCEEREFDVVILDVRMPQMDGIETLKELKKKHPLTEVIMLTGHGSVDSGIKGLQLGAYNYIMKPAKIDELTKQISLAYERKVIEQERTA
ncbi:MAG: response regulator [Desulfomonilaceae bacterium]|nr:response regulator [Desulfomonilaceae bacterium]